MAVRFSAVKLTANEQECKLLVSGVPTSLSDLEGWRMFENFVGEFDEDTKINVQAKVKSLMQLPKKWHI